MSAPVSVRVLVALAAAGMVLAGCQADTEPEASTTTEPYWPTATPSPPPDAGGFFTWEQTARSRGALNEVATTTHALEYFNELSARYDGYVDPRWPRLVSPKMRDRVNGSVSPQRLRGSVTYRLMTIQVRGDKAIVETCIDLRRAELAPRGTDDWSAYSPEIAGSVRTLVRSQESPTGWFRTTNKADGTVSRSECRRAFNTKEPAVTEVGEPDYLDSPGTE